MRKLRLECVICLYKFKDPRVLECGHTFCYVCLREHFSISRTCPLCKKQQTKPVENLPKNLDIAALLNKSIIESEEKRYSINLVGGQLDDHFPHFNNLAERQEAGRRSIRVAPAENIWGENFIQPQLPARRNITLSCCSARADSSSYNISFLTFFIILCPFNIAGLFYSIISSDCKDILILFVFSTALSIFLFIVGIKLAVKLAAIPRTAQKLVKNYLFRALSSLIFLIFCASGIYVISISSSCQNNDKNAWTLALGSFIAWESLFFISAALLCAKALQNYLLYFTLYRFRTGVNVKRHIFFHIGLCVPFQIVAIIYLSGRQHKDEIEMACLIVWMILNFLSFSVFLFALAASQPSRINKVLDTVGIVLAVIIMIYDVLGIFLIYYIEIFGNVEKTFWARFFMAGCAGSFLFAVTDLILISPNVRGRLWIRIKRVYGYY